MPRTLLAVATSAILAAVFVVIFVAAPSARATDWPQFRGPTGQGHSTSSNVPLEWSETQNITWKVPLPGLGWSSPAIVGEQIWLTTAVDEGHSLRALAVDRASGKTLHDVEIFQIAEPGNVHANNSHASPTPFIEILPDGTRRIYVHYGAHGTACLDDRGQIVWKTQELKYKHGHGPASSPIVWGDLVLLNCDGTDVQYVVALEKQSGKIAWKKDRNHISEARRTGKLEVPMAYCTPLMLTFDGRPQMVSLGSDAVVAYDPANGQELWWTTYSGYSNVSCPVYGKGLLFFATGFGSPEFHAVKVPGSGDLTEANSAWVNKKGAVVPLDVSPLLVGDELYTISDSGVAVCYDAATGKQHRQKRLGSKFWASPVLADGKIYCLDESGLTSVLKPGTELEVLSTNQLAGPAQASPAIVDGVIFLRTASHLYRIEKR